MRRRLLMLPTRGWTAAGLPHLAAGTGAEKPGPGRATADGEVERGSFAAGHPQPPPARQSSPAQSGPGAPPVLVAAVRAPR